MKQFFKLIRITEDEFNKKTGKTQPFYYSQTIDIENNELFISVEEDEYEINIPNELYTILESED